MNEAQKQQIYDLLGPLIFHKCENFTGVTPNELSERAKYLREQKGMRGMTPQTLVQMCKLNGERTMAKIRSLKQNVPIIIERIKRRDWNSTQDIGQYMDQINALINSPLFKTLPEGEKRFFVSLQRDLLSAMRRMDRDNYLNPGFTWQTISRL